MSADLLSVLLGLLSLGLYLGFRIWQKAEREKERRRLRQLFEEEGKRL